LWIMFPCWNIRLTLCFASARYYYLIGAGIEECRGM
jgi:hypothetical protein